VSRESAQSNKNNLEPLGLAAFDSLRAEDEPWLDMVFVPPPDFELMAGARSAVVFGEAGSGKTALLRALARRAAPLGRKPTKLLVNWYPLPLPSGAQADSYAVRAQQVQIFDACAVALFRHLPRYPDEFAAAPAWAKNTFAWFARQYLQGDFQARFAALLDETGPTGQASLRELVSLPPCQVLYPDAPQELIGAELGEALRELGLSGVWVLADGLGAWTGAERENLVGGLAAFLSALAPFEQARFAYKLLLPADLESLLDEASAVVRRRVDVYRLRWTTSALQDMVEKRLALAVSRERFALSDLCQADGLRNWLARCGGVSPRGWLYYTRPLLAAYLQEAQRGEARALHEEEWKAISKRHPPQLWLDEATRHVTVGWREIENLSPGEWALLNHLYQHRGRICSRRNLYYAYLNAVDPNRKPSDEIPAEVDYASVLDSALNRLRQDIEPLPDDPVLIATVKGRGVRLL
jgi:DNA-binding winged helix-turn-helix (wHTH) protein